MSEAEQIYNKMIDNANAAIEEYNNTTNEDHKRILNEFIENTLRLAAELGVAKIPPEVTRKRDKFIVED